MTLRLLLAVLLVYGLEWSGLMGWYAQAQITRTGIMNDQLSIPVDANGVPYPITARSGAGSGCSDVTLNTAITAIGSTRATLPLVPRDGAQVLCTWTLAGNVTTNANTYLLIEAPVVVNAGFTFTLNGPWESTIGPNWYSGDGTVTINYREPTVDGLSSFIVSGCAPAVPAPASATFAAFACRGNITHNSQWHHVNQAAAAVGPLTCASGTCWLALRRDTVTVPASWTCQAGTHYCWINNATKPAEPAGGLLFAEVLVIGGNIQARTFRRPVNTRTRIFNAGEYGVDFTGVVDAYPALAGMARDVVLHGGGHVLLPVGTYLIDQFVRWGPAGETDYSAGWNGIDHILWSTGGAVNIQGYGATINVKGNVDLIPEIAGVSSRNAMVNPFVVENCNNVSIEGVVINGNAQLLTTSAGAVTETGSRGIQVNGCTNVSLRNLVVHHSWTDGIQVRRYAPATPDRASRNVTIENVYAYNNGRCNIAAFEIRNLTLRNIRSYDGGKTQSSVALGGWSPQCNFGIEPDLTTPSTDIAPGFILVENADFQDSAQRNIYFNVRQSNVILRNIRLNNSAGDQQPLILSIPWGLLENSYIDTAGGRIDVAITGTTGLNVVTIRNNEIHTTSQGLFAAAQTGRLSKLIVEGNRFFRDGGATTARTPDLSHGGDMFDIIFRDNYVNIHLSSYVGAGQDVKVGLHVHLSENNIYETDLNHATNFFGVLYTDIDPAPRYVVTARNERFISPNNLSFRPADKSTQDNTVAYSAGRNLGASQWSVGGSATLTIPAATTQYMALLGVNGANTPEDNRTTVISQATVLGNLHVRTLSAQPGDGTLVFVLRRNGVGINSLTIAAGAAAGVYANTTDRVTFSAGDRGSIEVTNNSPGTVSAIITSVSTTADIFR